ncbi:MAG: hypothetical protein ACR2H1_15110, partial [Limisphaerales bacterium]
MFLYCSPIIFREMPARPGAENGISIEKRKNPFLINKKLPGKIEPKKETFLAQYFEMATLST